MSVLIDAVCMIFMCGFLEMYNNGEEIGIPTIMSFQGVHCLRALLLLLNLTR